MKIETAQHLEAILIKTDVREDMVRIVYNKKTLYVPAASFSEEPELDAAFQAHVDELWKKVEDTNPITRPFPSNQSDAAATARRAATEARSEKLWKQGKRKQGKRLSQ